MNSGTGINTAAQSSTDLLLPEILFGVMHFLRSYVVLSREQQIVLALWTAHTHAIEAADCTPYLQITSATAEAGKTRLLEVLELLVARPWLTGRTSAAALFRKVDAARPTLLLDESDAAFGGVKEYAEGLRAVLNTGYRASGRASICVGAGPDIDVKEFSTFGAKAIAGIGRLPDTLVSRSLRIQLRRRLKSESIRKFREREARGEAGPLYRTLEQWSATALDQLQSARPKMPDGLRDRAEDVVEPLLAIADQAGAGWPEEARRAVVMLIGTITEQDASIELLADIFDVFADTKTTFISSTELVSRLRALESRPWAWSIKGKSISTHTLAAMLVEFRIFPGKNPAGSVRGYHRDQFEDAWARYLVAKCPNRPSINQSGTPLNESNRPDSADSDTQGMPTTSVDIDITDASDTLKGMGEDQPGSTPSHVQDRGEQQDDAVDF